MTFLKIHKTKKIPTKKQKKISLNATKKQQNKFEHNKSIHGHFK